MAKSEKQFNVLDTNNKVVKSYVKKQSSVEYAKKYIGFYVIKIKTGEVVFRNEEVPVSKEPNSPIEEEAISQTENIETKEEQTIDNIKKVFVEPVLEEINVKEIEKEMKEINVEMDNIEEEERDIIKEISHCYGDNIKVYKKKSLLERIIDFIFRR